MRRFALPLLIAAALSVFAQSTDLSRDPLVRTSRDDGRLFTVSSENELLISSATGSGTLARYPIPLAYPIVDFATARHDDLFLLTASSEVVRWKPQSAGFDFRVKLDEGATAIAASASGDMLFVASRTGGILRLSPETGEIIARSTNQFRDVLKLRFDEASSLLYAENANSIAALPPALDRMDVSAGSARLKAPLASAGKLVANAYPVGLRIEPPMQGVTPGGTATFAIRTIPQNPSAGPWTLSYDSPLPGNLTRNALGVNDAVTLQIPVPANQPPGVYRIVAKLDNGLNGYASAVFIVPDPAATVIPVLGTGLTRDGILANGVADPNFLLVNPSDPECPTTFIVWGTYPLGDPWALDGGSSRWISGRPDASNGCLPGLYRFRRNLDLSDFDPATANIAVAVWGDNAATLEINGVAIPGEPQPASDSEGFRIARVYGIPRDALRRGSNSLDFIVRNDPVVGALRNPMGLRVEILYAAAKPTVLPEPPPVGDFWLSLSPPFKFVNGTTAYYTINVNRIGGFSGTPVFRINNVPPTGYQTRFVGNVLEVTRDPAVINAPTTWRFAVIGVFNQTARSVDGAFIQNPYTPVDLPVFSTGVLTPANPAPAGSVDPHYTLTASADPAFPGPAARVADEASSPIGPWVLNDQFSKWISPRADASNSNSPGVYRYRTTFDLGLGSAGSAALAIRWAADNAARVYLNGVLVTALLDPGNFRRMNEALILENFKAGLNTLEFEVTNLDLGGPSPQGLRVQIVGAQSARNPNRLVQVLRGQTATGPVPLTAGTFTHNAPLGVTITSDGTNLFFTASDSAPIGLWPIRITFTADSSTLDVLLVIGARNAVLYNVASTGQADEGTIDPNYRMVESADRLFLPPNAYVILSNTSPVSLGIWAPNKINSRWIAPRTDTLVNNAPGLYRYRTTFDLTGRNLADAVLALEWAADNRGRIELNGSLQDEINTSEGFRNMRPVSITSGFVPGVNTLDFVVINDGPTVNPTGLHVNILGAWAVSTGTAPGPDFSLTPDPGVRQIKAGDTTTFNVRITPNFTFDQFVNFSIVNPPSGFTFSFAPETAKLSSVLTVSTIATLPPGQYSITIRGRWGDIIRDTQVRVDILTSSQPLVVASTGAASVGSIDPNYRLVNADGSILANTFVADLSDGITFWSGGGTWIAPTPKPEERAAPGTYRYRTTFNVPPNVAPGSITISGVWDGDDTVYAVLNGNVVATLNKSSLFEPGVLSISSGFQNGVNNLDFVVTNNVASTTGLMVKITSVTSSSQ